jgi:hypothetical protein
VLFVPSVNGEGVIDPETGDMFVSELLSSESSRSVSDPPTWLVYDGKSAISSPEPASKVKLVNLPPDVIAACQITKLTLFGVISGVRNPSRGTEPTSHTVLHLMTRKASPAARAEWTLFNDFSIASCTETDARTFSDWRVPCVLFFLNSECPLFWKDGSLYDSYPTIPRVKVPASILSLNSISSVPCVSIHQPTYPRLYHQSITQPLAFDAEFVSVEVEKVEMDSRGQRIVHDEGRQVIARISILECLSSSTPTTTDRYPVNLLVDDYILPIEPIVDYVTRFSGLHEEDLNPVLSRHAVVPNRTAYLKLKYFVDCGHTFIGHGLQKDFDIANIFVPPEQVSLSTRPSTLTTATPVDPRHCGVVEAAQSTEGFAEVSRVICAGNGDPGK